MANLNLINLNRDRIILRAKSDGSIINYKHSQFPDGQQQISLEFNGHSSPSKDEEIVIYARLNNFMDLEKIICANQSLRAAGYTKISLNVPYFLGSRSDRKFSSGSNNYLKNVICPIINSQNFECVQVTDPHSDVLEACLNNYSKIPNYNLVGFALFKIKIDDEEGSEDRIVLVSPDGGALKKIYDLAEEFKIPRIITATKHRDIETGKITRTEIPVLDPDPHLKYVIVDDICDGGRTFIELAKVIRLQRADAKIYLIVTHGIFSQGIKPLSEYFESIFCTNSYMDILASDADTELESKARGKVIQYNVFPLFTFPLPIEKK